MERFLLVFGVFTLVSCGSSGGKGINGNKMDENSGDGGTSPVNSLVISEENMLQVARTVFRSADRVSGYVTDYLFTPYYYYSSEPEYSGDGFTLACADGGNVLHKGNIVDGDNPFRSKGDKLESRFSECYENDETISGSETFEILEYRYHMDSQSNVSPQSEHYRFIHSAFEIVKSDSEVVLGFDGTIDLYESTNDTKDLDNMRLELNNLELIEAGSKVFYKNYAIESEFDRPNQIESTSYTGTIETSMLQGSFSVVTNELLTIKFTSRPSYEYQSGSFSVEGASESKLWVDVVDDNNVLLRLDVDGDLEIDFEGEFNSGRVGL